MSRARVLRVGLTSAALLAGLCAAAPTASATIAHLHGGATVSYQRAPGASTPTASSFGFDEALTNLDYNGGPVMPSNTNYAVYWDPAGAPSYPGDYQSGINQYFEDLAHDSGGLENVDSISAQYNDAAGAFANYSSHFGGALLDEAPYPANGCPHATICLTDEQIRIELVKFVTSHHLPTDLAHEYFLLTPEGVESCFLVEEGSLLREACSANVSDGEFADYCSYHGNIPLEGGELIYSNDPFVNGKNCDEPSRHPNGKSSDSVLIGGLSYEHNESITDPEPKHAWTDWGGETGEIGDKCRTLKEKSEFGASLGSAENGAPYNQVINGHFYWYQQEWSNQSHQCLQRLAFSGDAPVATFTSEALSGSEMRFDATGSSAGAGVKYNWQFNDTAHAPSKASALETTSAAVTHKFPASEQFLVALTVVKGDGTSTGNARTIHVGDEGPGAAFAAKSGAPVVGTAVEFDASSSADADGSIGNFVWNFGDGLAGSGEKPSHTYAAPGTYAVTLTVTDASGQTASVSHQLTVQKGTQTIEFTSKSPLGAAVGGATYAVALTASSGLPVSISSGTPSICSLSGTVVHFNGAGTCTLLANQAGSAGYEPAPQAQQSFPVAKGSQGIAFLSAAPSGATVGGTYAIAAAASSGLPVSLFSQTPAVCQLTGATVTFNGAGTCTIAASQAGDGNYNAAPLAWQSFSIGAPPEVPAPVFSAPVPGFAFAPNSGFSSVSASVNRKTGAITFTESVMDPGTLGWLLTFRNGKFGAYAAGAGRCSSGFVWLAHRCRPARIVFASGAKSIALPGDVSFTARPSRSASRALRAALAHKRALPVVVKLSFQSALGGLPVVRTRSLLLSIGR